MIDDIHCGEETLLDLFSLGKLVGTTTMGAVIGTGSYSLIDGSTVRTPGVGTTIRVHLPTLAPSPNGSGPG